METSELMSGIGVVIDDALEKKPAVDGDVGNSADSIDEIVKWFETRWNIPFVKHCKLPSQTQWPNLLSAASFVLLDWQLWPAGAAELEKETIENIGKFLECAAKNLVPVFILTNENPEDVKSKLVCMPEHVYNENITDTNFVFFEEKKSFWNGESVKIERLKEWVYGNASVYALKTWNRSFDKARSDLFGAMCKRSINWPCVFWKNYQTDGAEPSSSLTTLINDSLIGRMRVDAFKGEHLKQQHAEILPEELRQLIGEASFRQKDVLPEDEIRCGDIFRQRPRKFWLNLRPDCDCIPRNGRPVDKVDLYCLECELIDLENRKEHVFKHGQFLSPVNQIIVFGVIDGDSILVRFNKLKVIKFSEVKQCRIGRLLHPYVTVVQQRYASYIQRQALPRIPAQAVRTFS